MSILIKGMEMPKDCVSCRWHARWGCEITHLVTNSAQRCPLVEVPTPHGWLIDADALMHEFAEFVRASNNSDFADVPTWNDAVSLLGSAPAIIEAEEGSGHQMAAITRRGEPHRRDGRQGGAP